MGRTRPQSGLVPLCRPRDRPRVHWAILASYSKCEEEELMWLFPQKRVARSAGICRGPAIGRNSSCAGSCSMRVRDGLHALVCYYEMCASRVRCGGVEGSQCSRHEDSECGNGVTPLGALEV